MSTISRKRVGAEEHHMNELLNITEKAIVVGEHKFEFRDASGTMLYVDTEKGLVWQVLDDGEHFYYNSLFNSSKANGYLYVTMQINSSDKVGKKEVYMCGIHVLVGILEMRDGYLGLVYDGKKPVLNHKDNCKWNNCYSNLEWGTTGENILHGKIVNSLSKVCPNVYTRIEHNGSKTDFVVLNTPLSERDIMEYKKKVKDAHVFKVKKNTDYIEERVLHEFVDWLIDTNRWQGHPENEWDR